MVQFFPDHTQRFYTCCIQVQMGKEDTNNETIVCASVWKITINNAKKYIISQFDVYRRDLSASLTKQSTDMNYSLQLTSQLIKRMSKKQ